MRCGTFWTHGCAALSSYDGRMTTYAAEQQYYVYLNSNTITASWYPYVKNYAPNQGFDYGNRAAALWLDR